MRKLYVFLIVMLILIGFQSKSQTYCTPSYSGTNTPNNFYCHILTFAFGEIYANYAAPWSNTGPFYYNYTYQSTDVVAGHTYPVWLILGNGGNTQTVSVWIDFNHNGVFETTERVLTKTDVANVGDHNVRGTVAIPANAYIGSTRLRIGTVYGTAAPDPCINNSTPDQHFQDYTLNIKTGTVQQYLSGNCYQSVLDEITKASANNQILEIRVNTNTDGTQSPLTLDTFYLSTLGTTNPADIVNAKLFYTGKSPEFSTTTQLGSTVNNPSTNFKIRANRVLEPGTNYFWLTYSVTATAIIGNALDARCNGIFIRTKRIPGNVDPSGTRNIGYCVSKGNKSNFVFISRVQMGNIDNTPNSPPYGTYYSATGYSNYTYLTDTLKKNKYKTLSVSTGNGVNTCKTRAWIDFNGDGFFDNVSELVLFDSISVASATAPNYGPVSDSFQAPINAPCGESRLRVISHYNPPTPPYRLNASPCDLPVEVGEVEDYHIIITDIGQPISNFSATVACLGSPNYFTDQSYTTGPYKINNWYWTFGDGDTSHQQNPQHTYSAPGVYTVTLYTNTNYSGGIQSVIKKAVKVNDPKANFSLGSNLYQTKIGFIDETSGGIPAAWYWDFGDPQSGYNNFSNAKSPGHIFDSVGKYRVMFVVTTEGGCVDTVYKTIVIDSTIVPVADFTAITFNPYFDQNLELVDISVNSPVSWKWTITPAGATYHNGTSSTSKNPVVSFNSVGTFNVKLVVTNAAGSDSITKNITSKTYTKPVAEFIANPLSVRAGQVVSFLDQSTNDPTSWSWSFGDGDSSNLQHPVHIYNNVGNYTVNLTAKNPAGSSTKTRANYIKVTNEYQVCDNDAPSSTLFSGLIFDSGGKNGDYKTNSNCGFLIKPDCSGPINLTFTLFDYDATDVIRIYDGENNKGKLLHTGNGFTGTSTPPRLTAYSGAMYIEEISDGTAVSTGFSAYWNAIPNIRPVASFDCDPIGYLHGPVNFTNTTLLGTGNTYYWDYDGDGIYEDTNVINGRHTYHNLGYDTVTLKAENCKGISVVKNLIHIINPTTPPVADFSSDKDTALELESVYFYDQSSMGPTSWKWEVNPPCPYYCYFADGTSDTSQNPVVQFFDIGPYDISLTASNNIGTGAKTTKYGKIYIKTKASMCTWPFEINLPAGRIFDAGDEFGNYGNNENCGLLLAPCAEKVYLNFSKFEFLSGDVLRVFDGKDNTGKPLHPGTGFTSTTVPTSTLIAESGSMYIEEVTNGVGTAAGFEADFWVKPIGLPKAKYNVPDTVYTSGYITYFDNVTTGKVDTFFWDYDYDGKYDDTVTTGSYQYTVPGYHYAQLTALNCSGINRYSRYFLVQNPSKKPRADFEASMQRADTSNMIVMKDRSKYGPNTWLWSFYPNNVTFMDGTDSTSIWPHVKFSKSGYYTVRLIVSNSFGTDTIIKSNYIYIFTYCVPAVSTLLNNFGISRFVLNGINNLTPCGKTAYTDFSKTYSTSIELGGTYNFEVSSILNNSYSRKIWIDYNQDGYFNDTTELAAVNLDTTALIWRGSFKVPSNASFGQTRLRIGVNVAGYMNKPCGPNYFGEFEDYLVYITEDKTPPVITMKGFNPAMTELIYPYVDSGAVALDAVDGNITSKMSTVSNVDTSKVGVYTVKYNVSDKAGNDADEVIRTVYVTPDKTKPVITLKGSNPMIVEVFYPYVEPGATAIDNKDGNVSGNIVIQSTVDTSRIDTYSVFYSVYDFSNNFSDMQTRTVFVVDTIPPVIHLIGPDTVAVAVGATYTDSGATVTDNYYSGIIPTKNQWVNTAIDGWYWVKYNALDPSGNHANTVKRTVKVGNPIGLPENIAGDNIIVYPNPSKGFVNIEYDLARVEDIKLEILNQLGQQLTSANFRQIQKKTVTFDLNGYTEGIYMIRSVIGNSVYVIRIALVK